MMIRRVLAAVAVGGMLSLGVAVGTAEAQAVLKPLTAADVAKVCENPRAADRAREALGCAGPVTVPVPVTISTDVTVAPGGSQPFSLTCPDGLTIIPGSITYSPPLPGFVEAVGRTETETGYSAVFDASGMTESFTTTASITCV